MEEIPFDDRRVPKAEIDWDRSCWWWYPVTRALHPAIRMTSLAVSLVALLVVAAGWKLGLLLFKPDVELVVESLGVNPGLFRSNVSMWYSFFVRLLAEMLGPLDFQGFSFWTFEILWASLTVAIFGGILARRAMIELGQRTVAPWFHSVKLVVSRWQSYLWVSGMNLVGIGALLILPVLFGFISRFGSGGAYVGGALLILFFPLAFGVGRFVLSLTICFPLSVCAIGAEKKADAFEGFSRSNAYFFQRPVIAVVFAAALFVCGYVGEFLVSTLLNAGWSLFRNSYLYSGGMSQPASEPFVATGNWLAQSLIQAFWFSYFWSASGALYLILRRSVDHTELSEIDLAEQAAAQELPEIPPAPKVEETKADAATAGEASAE
jgi:hypothetical protein